MTPTLDAIARDWAEREYAATVARVVDVTGAVRTEAHAFRRAVHALSRTAARTEPIRAALARAAADLEDAGRGDPERRFHAQRRLMTYGAINRLCAEGIGIDVAVWRLVNAALATWPARLSREAPRYRAAMTRRLFGQGRDREPRLAERLRRRYFAEDKAARE